MIYFDSIEDENQKYTATFPLYPGMASGDWHLKAVLEAFNEDPDTVEKYYGEYDAVFPLANPNQDVEPVAVTDVEYNITYRGESGADIEVRFSIDEDSGIVELWPIYLLLSPQDTGLLGLYLEEVSPYTWDYWDHIRLNNGTLRLIGFITEDGARNYVDTTLMPDHDPDKNPYYKLIKETDPVIIDNRPPEIQVIKSFHELAPGEDLILHIVAVDEISDIKEVDVRFFIDINETSNEDATTINIIEDKDAGIWTVNYTIPEADGIEIEVIATDSYDNYEIFSDTIDLIPTPFREQLRVIGTEPFDGAVEVSTKPVITLTFNQEIELAPGFGSLVLNYFDNDQSVTGQVYAHVDAGNNGILKITLDSDESLPLGTYCELVIPAGSVSGFNENFSLGFRVKEPPLEFKTEGYLVIPPDPYNNYYTFYTLEDLLDIQAGGDNVEWFWVQVNDEKKQLVHLKTKLYLKPGTLKVWRYGTSEAATCNIGIIYPAYVSLVKGKDTKLQIKGTNLPTKGVTYSAWIVSDEEIQQEPSLEVTTVDEAYLKIDIGQLEVGRYEIWVFCNEDYDNPVGRCYLHLFTDEFKPPVKVIHPAVREEP
ncbi:MAG: Ig-like domain-containing protein [Clostridia bacterium]|nr:Ig-like domain-containing protein [Clostridia bacterium]